MNIVIILSKLWQAITNATYHTVITHDGIEHAGYLSFLGLLSGFPFMVFLVALAGFIGEGELGRHFIALMRDNMPAEVVEALMPRINEIISGPSPGLLTVSMLAALWTASSAVEGYRTVLNRAYHVGTPPAYIWRRLLSIAQLLLFSFLVLMGMLLLVVTPILLDFVTELLADLELDVHILHWEERVRSLSIMVIFVVIVMMYYILPNIKQNLKAVLPGALVTLAFWLLAVEGLRFYLISFDQVNLIYGSLGGVIAALLFFYIINIIFIFGAEFNYQLLRCFGSNIEEKQETSADSTKNSAHEEEPCDKL